MTSSQKQSHPYFWLQIHIHGQTVSKLQLTFTYLHVLLLLCPANITLNSLTLQTETPWTHLHKLARSAVTSEQMMNSFIRQSYATAPPTGGYIRGADRGRCCYVAVYFRPRWYDCVSVANTVANDTHCQRFKVPVREANKSAHMWFEENQQEMQHMIKAGDEVLVSSTWAPTAKRIRLRWNEFGFKRKAKMSGGKADEMKKEIHQPAVLLLLCCKHQPDINWYIFTIILFHRRGRFGVSIFSEWFLNSLSTEWSLVKVPALPGGSWWAEQPLWGESRFDSVTCPPSFFSTVNLSCHN